MTGEAPPATPRQPLTPGRAAILNIPKGLVPLPPATPPGRTPHGAALPTVGAPAYVRRDRGDPKVAIPQRFPASGSETPCDIHVARTGGGARCGLLITARQA
jgi:hypothetical protein